MGDNKQICIDKILKSSTPELLGNFLGWIETKVYANKRPSNSQNLECEFFSLDQCYSINVAFHKCDLINWNCFLGERCGPWSLKVGLIVNNDTQF